MSDKIKLVVTSNRLHLLLMANRWPTMSVHQECAYLQEHSSDTCCFRVRGYYPGIYDGGGGSYQFIFNLILLTQSMVNALDSNLCSLKSEKCSSNNITTKWFGVWNCCWCREVTSGFRATDFFFFFFFFRMLSYCWPRTYKVVRGWRFLAAVWKLHSGILNISVSFIYTFRGQFWLDNRLFAVFDSYMATA